MNKTFILREPAHVQAMTAFLNANWRACADGGKPLSVTVAEHRARRTGEQNRFYWRALGDIAANAWVDGRQYDPESWHEFFKRFFLGVEEAVLPGGEVLTRGISTTTLSIPEMADYLDRVIGYATEELGLEM